MGNKIHASMPEEESESMKDPKKKMGDWWHNWWKCWEKLKINHPKTACSLQYVSLFLFVFLVGHVLFGMANHVYFRYPFNDTSRHPISVTANLTINGTTETYVAEMYADNARSILCTLVGCEAAIVAIVVSLTLIAIELTASEYSPRVIDISLRNLDMWILLLIYGMSIFYALVLIKQVPLDSRMLFDDVSFAFWLGVFSYAALFPYLRNIIWLLKPKNIITRLASEITCEKISTTKEDKFQPIVDITRRSIMKHDFETTRVALEAVTDHAIQAILSGCGAEISKSFCDQLQGLGKLAARVADEESTKEVITSLKKITIETMKKDIKTATTEAIKSLEVVGNAAADKGKEIEIATRCVILALREVGTNAVENKCEEAALKVASTLLAVGTTALRKEGLDNVVEQLVSSLEYLGTTALREKKLETAVGQLVLSLKEVGTIALAKKEREAIVLLVVLSLKNVGTTAAKNGREEATRNVTQALLDIGTTAAKNGREEATRKVISSLKCLSTTLSGKIAKTAIRDYKQNLEKTDLTFSPKVYGLWEKELEKYMQINQNEEQKHE